jgi:hypothetical protein
MIFKLRFSEAHNGSLELPSLNRGVHLEYIFTTIEVSDAIFFSSTWVNSTKNIEGVG